MGQEAEIWLYFSPDLNLSYNDYCVAYYAIFTLILCVVSSIDIAVLTSFISA